MPQAKTIYVYSFDELDDAAKEKAREWYREASQDDEWWDSVYDDAKECGRLLGIEVDKIYFSGFWSQGDGACFEGSYSYTSGAARAIKEHAPTDEKLHAIAAELQSIQRPWFYGLSATIKHSGHYSHEYCTEISVQDIERPWSSRSFVETEEELITALRDFMRWIYARLEEEWNWLNGNEQVDETIQANEYEFDEHGGRL